MPSVPLKTRERLSEVRYEIRGELARRARELEAQGRKQIKLNSCSVTSPPKDNTAMSYLALGDSYTIGEGVPDAGRCSGGKRGRCHSGSDSTRKPVPGLSATT